jgi:hypothetical protein
MASNVSLRMKRAKKTLATLVVLGALALTCGYAYMEPQSWIGGIFLRSKYNPEDPHLQKISSHLLETNGGYLPDSFDRYLFRRLEQAEPDSTEFRNIIAFYASQSMGSRAGSKMFEDGDQYLPSVIGYGREATPENRQQGYLFLAYGIASKEQAYKPSLFFFSSDSIDDCFGHVERGDLHRLRIETP